MTGVWVKMDGVGVKGRKGVGGLLGSGCMIQPLQEDNSKAISSVGTIRFILSPRTDCISLEGGSKVPNW
jgi:hypothetical protein